MKTLLWLAGAALLAVAAFSVYSAFRSPEFVLGLVSVMLVAVYKAIGPHLAKRMSPEQEKAYHDCLKSGGNWDNFRKRCRDK